MPKTTNQNTEVDIDADQDETRSGVRFLKHGMLAQKSVVQVNGVPTPGRFAGKIDIPLSIDDQNFILSISEKNPQFSALRGAFGAFPEWKGKRVEISDGAILKTVNIKPVQ